LRLGVDNARAAAEAKGKKPTRNDFGELEIYLEKEVIPIMKQHAPCKFRVVSLVRPYFGIEQSYDENIGERLTPRVTFKNTAQSVFKHFVLGQLN
jgi:hypothetical protein